MKVEHGALHNYKRYIDEDEFREKVAEQAYFKAEKRGFEDGYELHDWLEAEHEMGQKFFY